MGIPSQLVDSNPFLPSCNIRSQNLIRFVANRQRLFPASVSRLGYYHLSSRTNKAKGDFTLASLMKHTTQPLPSRRLLPNPYQRRRKSTLSHHVHPAALSHHPRLKREPGCTSACISKHTQTRGAGYHHVTPGLGKQTVAEKFRPSGSSQETTISLSGHREGQVSIRVVRDARWHQVSKDGQEGQVAQVAHKSTIDFSQPGVYIGQGSVSPRPSTLGSYS